MNGSRSTIVACSSGVVLSRGCFAHRAWILRLQPLLDAVCMEVVPAFQYPQHILVFVTLLSECIHRSEIEFNSFGPWLYNINLLSISLHRNILRKCTRQMTQLPSSWSSWSICIWSELQQTTSFTHFEIFSSAKPVLTLPIDSPKAKSSCRQRNIS